MNLMGMGVGGYRLPLCPMDEKNREALAASMKEAVCYENRRYRTGTHGLLLKEEASAAVMTSSWAIARIRIAYWRPWRISI